MISNCLNLLFVIHIGLGGRAFTLQIGTGDRERPLHPGGPPLGLAQLESLHILFLCASVQVVNFYFSIFQPKVHIIREAVQL